jgi:hypothetical protein
MWREFEIRWKGEYGEKRPHDEMPVIETPSIIESI